jgi:hypothetical protein
MTCSRCEQYEGKPWFTNLKDIAVLAPYIDYMKIREMLLAMADKLGHPDNISGLQSLLLHLMGHEREKSAVQLR